MAEIKSHEIKSKSSLFELNLKELWRYKDLLLMFVKRDLVAVYKQTILGPLWFFIQPLLTTLVFTVVFGNIAKISTAGLPKMLFYLSGITVWNYFSVCLLQTSDTFFKNAAIFGKVYFPRLISPISIVISSLVQFFIQLLLFIGVYVFFRIKGVDIHMTSAMLLLPVLVLIMGMLGLSLGLIFSSLTTKYRDLKFLLSFGVQLFMYATPVIYPMSSIPAKYAKYIKANPLSPIIETFRYAWMGVGDFRWGGLVYSFTVAIILLLFGAMIFNKVEKSFMDTV